MSDGGDDGAPTAGDGIEASANSGDSAEDDEVDWEMAPDSERSFETDPETVRLLRDVGDDIYGDSSESRQLSAIVYRISDLYDAEGDTSPEEIYLNVRHIMNIKEQGGLRPDS
ncbi:hypothetical protein ACFO0N_04035 [Halobium salinum]|uniref:Transcriptional regulator n=1 Tax=Halobium salinum TaxID=1364940 RepID=A0ABD5P8N7_9EURY|nr:hypothetical protein [Halobium salinum]